MNNQEILIIFKKQDALLEGHFVLSSGLHSANYLQCARLMMNPFIASKLCAALLMKLPKNLRVDLVASPAMGGVVVGYEMARQLGVDAIFSERENGAFVLRRGFSIPQNASVLVVEDVLTTGKSSLEAIACFRSGGAKIVAEAALVNRSGVSDSEVSRQLDLPFFSLTTIDFPVYSKENVPESLSQIPITKPGSRFINQT